MGNQQSRLERDHATVSEAEARFAERNRITSKQRKNWQGRPKVVQNSKQFRKKSEKDAKAFRKLDKKKIKSLQSDVVKKTGGEKYAGGLFG